jgi:hypothetical protein
MQQSDKHGPATDEAIKNPRVEQAFGYKARARPVEDDDAAVMDEIVPRPDVTVAAAPDPDAVRDRSELASFLNPSAFPADREELLRIADENDAPEWVRSALRELPPQTRFATSEEVWEAARVDF